MADNPLEIPQALRDLSEQNMKQAHAAYEQLTEFMTKAMGAWMGAMPANPMTAGLQRMQDRAMQIAMENAEQRSRSAARSVTLRRRKRFCSFRRSLLKTGCKPSSRRRSNCTA